MRYVMAFDGSSNSKLAFKYLCNEIILKKDDFDKDHLYIITVLNPAQCGTAMLHYSHGGISTGNYEQSDHAKNVLHKASMYAKSLKIPHSAMLYSGEKVGKILVSFCTENNVDTICCGSLGLNSPYGLFKKYVIGSVSNYLQQNAPCRVIIVKPAPSPGQIKSA